MRVMKKLVIIMVVLTLLLPLTPIVGGVSANTSGSNANEMTRSMITFFRDDRTDLAIGRVARDEIMVYGVFLSNFFIPWETKVRDMIDDTTDTSIPKRVSEKFFGSQGKSKQISELNRKLYEPILTGLGSTTRDFALYATPNTSGPVMSGEDLFRKLVGKYQREENGTYVPDMYIYNSSGNPVLDLSNKAVQAAIQVVFAIEPEYFIQKDKGLRALTELHMDGLGNIWGAYNNVDFSEYILFLPSALNPVVFSNSLTDVKFPVSNVFVMGGLLKMNGDFLSNRAISTPYYNIGQYFPTSTTGSLIYNSENTLTIFGVHTPSRYLGNSDDIIINGGSISQDRIKSFLNSSTSEPLDKRDAYILVSLDMTQAEALDRILVNDGSLTREDKYHLINYLFRTTVFNLSEVADEMYFFDNPGTQVASDPDAGSWKDDDSLMRRQTMFSMEILEEDSSGNRRVVEDKFQFHNGSYMPSPFSKFLSEYLRENDPDVRRSILEDRFNSGKKLSDKLFNTMDAFLREGHFNDEGSGTIEDMFAKISGGGDLVYNILRPQIDVRRIRVDEVNLTNIAALAFFYWSEITAFGLSSNDNYTVAMSVFAGDSTNFERIFGSNPYKSHAPFGTTKWGGNLDKYNKSKEHTDSLVAYFHNFMTYNIFTMNRTFTSGLTGMAANSSSTIKTPWGDRTPESAIMNGVNNYPGIYWGYMVQLLNIERDSDGNWSSRRFYNNFLPPMNINTLGGSFDLNSLLGTSGVVTSEDRTLEEMQEDIIKKVYGLLSDGPNSYRDRLIKSSQDSWVLSTHRSITGSWVGNVLSVSAGGNSSYASIVGYINTPSLTDLPLTAWLLTDYMYVYLFLLLLILIVLILMTLSNIRTVREALLIFIVMAFILVLPQYLIGNVINISNSVGDKMYSGRFNYWAITQHEQSLSTLRTAAISGNEIDYIIARNMEDAKNVYTSDVGVRVKWMSPKKDDLFEQMFNRTSTSQSLTSNLTIFRWLFNSYMNQEEYVYDDPLATYLYRPYNAIALAASESYSELIGNVIRREDIAPRLASKRVPGQRDYKFKLVIDPSNSNIDFTPQQQDVIDKVATLYTSPDKAEQEHYRYWIYNSPALMDAIFNTDYETNVGYGGSVTDPYYNAYSLLTESPFYYFYNVLKARYGENSAYTNSNTFKNSLLEKSVFFAEGTDTSADGKLRDFLDLEGLFTYIIPYLQQGNEYVYGWTNIHGTSIDMYEFKDSNIPVDPNSPEYQKYMYEKQKKENLKKVWKLYSPWVDQIYSLDVYSKGVRIADKKVIVEDILNPGAYDEAGRPMIFSEADMRAKNYQVADLTDIERRIQNTLRSTYTDLMYLTNYYDFNDEVLVTAAAMLATFNFNREFSETKLFGESHVLHPQNFELKNFNYDAFMRLLLLNSTGEPLMAEQDLYVRILHKTSIFTGIALIICDFLAVIAIPTMKIAVLLLMLFLSLAVILSCVIAPPDRIFRTIMRAIALPAFLFLVASIVFAFVVSLFLGEGLTGYVGSRTPTLGFTDPTTTLWLMAIVDCVYIYVLWKILKMLLDSFKTHITTSITSTVAMAVGLGSSIITGAVDRVKGAVGYGMRRRDYNKMYKAVRGAGEAREAFGGQGGGGENSGGDISSPRSSGVSDSTNQVGPKIDSDEFRSEIDEKASNRTEPRDEDSGETSEIDEKASSRADSDSGRGAEAQAVREDDVDGRDSSIEESSKVRSKVVRRSIGEKFVDYKYKLRETADSVSDGARRATSYVMSRDGLRRDISRGTTTAVRKVRDGATSAAQKTREGVSEAKTRITQGATSAVHRVQDGIMDTRIRMNKRVHDLQRYEMDKLADRVVSQEARKNESHVSKRQEKDADRLIKLEAKAKAREEKIKLLEARKQHEQERRERQARLEAEKRKKNSSGANRKANDIRERVSKPTNDRPDINQK